jgi:hypothetical protein
MSWGSFLSCGFERDRVAFFACPALFFTTKYIPGADKKQIVFAKKAVCGKTERPDAKGPSRQGNASPAPRHAKGPSEPESSGGPDVALNAEFRSGTEAYFMSLPTF